MENQLQGMERLEHAATLLERTLAWLEGHELAGDVEKIAAAVDSSAREEELAGKLAEAEREISELRAAAAAVQKPAAEPAVQPTALQVVRRTVPASTADMLAKHGIGDAPVDVRTLDAALTGLSLEQRIAVKSQLLRAGAVA